MSQKWYNTYLILPKDYMSNLATANQTNASPPERNKVPAQKPVRNDFEESLEKPIGYYEPYKPQTEGFSATGFMDLTPSPIIKEGPVTKSNILKPGQWVDFTDKAANIASKVVGTVANSASTGLDAGVDLVNQVFGLDQKSETQKPVDPQKQAEKQKIAADYQYMTQKQQDNEDTISSIQKFLTDNRLDTERQKIAELAGMQQSFRNVISSDGTVRIDLQAPIESKAEERTKIRAMAPSGSISSASKHQGANLNQNEAPEGKSQLSAFKVQ